MRQAVYATLRLGLYFNFSDYIKANINNGGNLTPLQKAGCSLTAGLMGAFAGNPFDLCLVRMQADSTLPVEERRNYTGVFNAVSRIVKDEGITSLYKGATPTMARAGAMNMSMLITYEEIKERVSALLGPSASFRKIQLGASATAAIIAVFASLPFDNVKTKL
jgi:solute carrier family 25 oxoglutarate transporter 11